MHAYVVLMRGFEEEETYSRGVFLDRSVADAAAESERERIASGPFAGAYSIYIREYLVNHIDPE